MSVQGIVVAVLVVLAAVYVARRLALRRWLWRLGIGRRGRGSSPGAGGGECGCSDCPVTPKARRPGG
jgi:hypothetical protein